MFTESFSMLLSYLIFPLFFFLCLFHFFYFLFGRCRVQYFIKDQESQWPRKDLNYEPVIRSRWMHCTASHGHLNVWLLKKTLAWRRPSFKLITALSYLNSIFYRNGLRRTCLWHLTVPSYVVLIALGVNLEQLLTFSLFVVVFCRN